MLDTSNLNPMTLLIVLLLLLQVAMLMSIIALYRHTKRNQETGQATPAVAAPAAAAIQAAPVAGADTALVAAITGALSFYFAQEAPEGAAPQGFVVRRIRRVH